MMDPTLYKYTLESGLEGDKKAAILESLLGQESACIFIGEDNSQLATLLEYN